MYYANLLFLLPLAIFCLPFLLFLTLLSFTGIKESHKNRDGGGMLLALTILAIVPILLHVFVRVEISIWDKVNTPVKAEAGK